MVCFHNEYIASPHSYLPAFGTIGSTASYTWRVPVILQCIFLVIMLAIIMILPESPRWLAAHGKADESLAVLQRLNRHRMSEDDISLTHAQIMTTVAYEASIGAGKWKDLLRNDEIQSQRRFLIACSVQAFQQLGGINVSTSSTNFSSNCVLTGAAPGTDILCEYPVCLEPFFYCSIINT